MKETVTSTDPRIIRLTVQADDITKICANGFERRVLLIALRQTVHHRRRTFGTSRSMPAHDA